MELEGVFTEGLQAHARRSLGGVTESYRYGIAVAQKAMDDLDIERSIPRPHIALRIIAILQNCIIGSTNRRVSDASRILELGAALIRRETKTYPK